MCMRDFILKMKEIHGKITSDELEQVGDSVGID